jgi:hypothetical protein
VAQVQVAESRLRAVMGLEFDDANVDNWALKDIVEKIAQSPSLTDGKTWKVSNARN